MAEREKFEIMKSERLLDSQDEKGNRDRRSWLFLVFKYNLRIDNRVRKTASLALVMSLHQAINFEIYSRSMTSVMSVTAHEGFLIVDSMFFCCHLSFSNCIISICKVLDFVRNELKRQLRLFYKS